jgi:putative transcriptional regulator
LRKVRKRAKPVQGVFLRSAVEIASHCLKLEMNWWASLKRLIRKYYLRVTQIRTDAATNGLESMGKSDFSTMDNLLARYVAGTLPSPVNMAVGAHLELKQDNRDFVESLEALAGETVEAMPAAAVSDRENRLDKIFSHEQEPQTHTSVSERGMIPSSLAALVPHKIDTIPWRAKMPGYKECALGVIEGCEVNLLWIRAGRKMPAHTHEGSEITLVLDGAFSDSRGRYERGDIALADEDVDHSPIAENDRPCICLAITDAPLRLTGSYRQFFSEFIGR